MRRKDEVWRRQEKHTHSDAVAEETMEGRREPLSDWKAIVGGGVAVFDVVASRLCRAQRCFGWLRDVVRRTSLLPRDLQVPQP